MCKLYSFEYRSRYFSLEVNKPLGLQITLGSGARVTFRVMKFGRYVTVDDGDNLCRVSVDPSIY